ncbi:hypothetical protein [Streptomyces sp. NPDC058653]|uniref:hypothetical protein n=1 Tax=Streptomyces sp. NPDC058653 TaxID=3346576 RepID=UPI003663CFF3
MNGDSRKAIYGAYADRYKESLDHVRHVYLKIALATDMSEHEANEQVTGLLDSWREPTEVLETAESAVNTEGPEAVARSARSASRALTHFGTVVLESITTNKGMREIHVEAAKEAYGPTYRAYLEFLYAAAESLGEDDFLRLRS